MAAVEEIGAMAIDAPQHPYGDRPAIPSYTNLQRVSCAYGVLRASSIAGTRMPRNTGSRLQVAFVCFAIVAFAASRMLAMAAAKASLSPDEAREAASFVLSMAVGDVSLTGFHCSVINASGAAEAFNEDPDDMETPPTIGLEFVFDAGGASSHAGAGRAGLEDGQASEMRTPLSARLNRVIIQGGGFSLTDGGGVEDVSLPEASMSVADIVDRCHPD